MRTLKRAIIILGMVLSVLAIAFTFWMRDRYVVPILMYHRVDPTGHAALNSVSPQTFERQMRFLKKFGYDVISFNDLVEGIKKGYVFARNSVVIQFDDGFEDNYIYAFPILKKYEFPAMVFVISDSVGTKPFLSWDQIKEMEDYEFEAGCHTRRHKYLPSLNSSEKWDEIAGCKQAVEAHLGHPIEYFAYPSGGFDQEVKDMAKKAGFKAAVSTNRGKDRYNQKLFEINRIHVKDTDNSLILWWKLSGYYNLFRKFKECKDCNY